MATTILCEIRDVRKRQIFLQMSAEIEDLKKKLTKALDFAEHYQKRSKSLALENDWLHSLTNTPAVSPAKQIVRTPMNLDEISEKLKKIGCQKITLDPNGALELDANGKEIQIILRLFLVCHLLLQTKYLPNQLATWEV